MRLSEAKKLEYGMHVCHKQYRNADGTPQRFKVNGRPKTWKTRPDAVQVPLKRGLYEYLYMTQDDTIDSPSSKPFILFPLCFLVLLFSKVNCNTHQGSADSS